MAQDGASVGTVFVDVVPDSSGFWAKLQTQIAPGAERIGKDIGKTIADQIAKGIRDGLGDGFKGAPGKEPGRRTGEDFAGEFDRTVRTRIMAALKALPKAQIGAATTEAEQKIRDLRQQLTELSGKRIGVDISDAEAIAEIRRIQEELRRLGANTVSVRVAADTGKAGAELAALQAEVDRIAKLNPNIHVGLDDGLKGAPGKEPGRRTGEDFAGEFDRTVRTRIAAALKALPKAQIGAAATEAEQKIRDLRQQLAELSGKRIGLDISDAQAIAEIRRVQEELARLARESPSIRVSTDAGRAVTELEAIRAEAERVAKLNPNIRVDTDAGGATSALTGVDSAADRASSGLSALATAGTALGPAIIPTAAAAAAAVAAIGSAAIAGGAALGVGVLAVSGVVGAVQAMSAAQNDAGKTAVSLASHQTQVAGAVDQVRSAEASLANARASAADSAVKAAQRITDAQRTLTDAQGQALRAQQALTEARKAEKQAEEDLASSVEHNALAQRQAQLDLADAQTALNAVLANPATTLAQREQARITFEEAKLHAEDLGREHVRLGEQQAHAAQVGVDGSKQVQAAQLNVAQTQEQVGKAEQGLADARKEQTNQARQSAFSIAQAQQGVVNAQRSLEQATVQTGTSGSAAMDKLKQTMAALSPEGQRFATFLFGLSPILTGLRHEAEAGFLPGLQDGITALLPLLPSISGLVGTLAHDLGGLASEAGHAFGSPYWASFITFIGQTAGPILETFGRSAYNVALGLSGIVRAVSPLNADVGGGLLRFTQQFALYSLTLQQNPSFQRLLAYVRTEGPIVVATIIELVKATGHLVVAVAPIGGVVVDGLRVFAQIIQAIPVPVLTATAVAIVGIVLAMKLWSLAQAAADTQIFVSAQLLLSQTVNGARAAMAATGPEVGVFGRALAGIQGGASAAAGGVRGLAGMIGPGGLLAIGLTAATLAVGSFVQQQQAQQQRVESLKTALLELDTAYHQFGSGTSDAVQSIVRQNEGLQTLILNTSRYGLTVRDVVAAVDGDAAARQRLAAAYDAQIKQLDLLFAKQKDGRATTEDYAAAGVKEGTNLDHLIQQRKEEKKSLDLSIEAKSRADSASRALAAAEQSTTNATAKLTPAQQALGEVLKVVADDTSTAAQRADTLRVADERVFGAARNAVTAEQDQALALIAVANAGRQNAEQQVYGKATLDLHSEASIRNRQMLEQRFLALGQEYIADVQAGVGLDTATQKHDANRDAVIKAAQAAGFDTGEVHKLADTFGTLPTDPKVQITVAGVQEALTGMRNLEIAQLALRQGIPVDQAAKEYQAQHRTAAVIAANPQGLAAGGPVSGPGGPTDDKVVSWGPGDRLVPRWRLSPGEHVWTAAEVKAAGGHDAILALRRLVLQGRSPRATYPGDGSGGIAFARGGAVAWPFPVDLTHTFIPSLAQAQASAFGPVTELMSAAQAFVRAQVGKPYIWEGAGPAGYDCSGLVSAAWRVAHGLSPYSHTFSTFNEAPYFPKPGYGTFTAGWTNPGERGPGGDSVGHTAAMIGGLKFESIGGLGVRTGPSVTPIDSFAHVGTFDRGGPLPPGLSIADNRTGKTEWVFTDEQLRAGAAAAGDGATFNVVLSAADPAMRELLTMIDVRVERAQSQVARSVGGGVRA